MNYLGQSSLEELFAEEHVQLAGATSLAIIDFLAGRIQVLEKAILKEARLKPAYERLMTVPGIGKILALTIMYETGEVERFKGVGNYASYCRCVRSSHMSNQRKKSEGNRKNGNRYLGWAYVEAAHHAQRSCVEAKKFYQRKLARRNATVARKALACKLCKASYFIIRDQVDFNMQKIFG
jgi:transposase